MSTVIPPYAVSEMQPLFFGVDPVLVGMVTFMLLLVFALFLFIRKTLLNFSEGVRQGKSKK